MSRWKVMGLIENGWQELVLKKELKVLIEKTLKDDGSVRHWVARVRVKKGVKRTSTRKQKDNWVTAFDVKINSFRTIDVSKLLSYSCGGLSWKVE